MSWWKHLIIDLLKFSGLPQPSQADKRGICESMPWINKVPFISVTLLDLPYRNFCSKAHYYSNKTLSILHVRYWDVNHCTASAGQALTARDEQKSRGSPWAGCGRMKPTPAQRPSEQCLFAGETPRERSWRRGQSWDGEAKACPSIQAKEANLLWNCMPGAKKAPINREE